MSDKPSVAEAIAAYLVAKSDLELAVWIRDNAPDGGNQELPVFDAQAAVAEKNGAFLAAGEAVDAAIDRRISRYVRSAEILG